MKNSRIVMDSDKGQYIVVHEGLQNVPTTKASLQAVVDRLTGVINGDAHLSDCGCALSFASRELMNLSKECFTAHEIEKSGVAF